MSTVVSVTFSVALQKTIRELGKLECRSMGRQASYYLEVMAGAAKQLSGLRQKLLLQAPTTSPFAADHNKFEVSDETYDYLLDWAGSLGLKMSSFVRLALHNAAKWDEKVGQGLAVEKEEFIKRVLAAIAADCPPTIQ